MLRACSSQVNQKISRKKKKSSHWASRVFPGAATTSWLVLCLMGLMSPQQGMCSPRLKGKPAVLHAHVGFVVFPCTVNTENTFSRNWENWLRVGRVQLFSPKTQFMNSANNCWMPTACRHCSRCWRRAGELVWSSFRSWGMWFRSERALSLAVSLKKFCGCQPPPLWRGPRPWIVMTNTCTS